MTRKRTNIYLIPTVCQILSNRLFNNHNFLYVGNILFNLHFFSEKKETENHKLQLSIFN